MRRFGLRLTEGFWAGCFCEGDEGGGGSGAGDGQGAEGDGKSGGAGDGSDAGKGDGKGGEEKFDAAYVKSLRDEAAKNRREAKTLADRLKALEDEKLSDTEKREKRLKELEEENGRLSREKRTASIEAAAARAGARDADVVARLVPDDAEDVGKAIAAIKREKAYLFGTGSGSADGGAGGQGRGGVSMNDLIRGARGS